MYKYIITLRDIYIVSMFSIYIYIYIWPALLLSYYIPHASPALPPPPPTSLSYTYHLADKYQLSVIRHPSLSFIKLISIEVVTADMVVVVMLYLITRVIKSLI